MAQERMDEFKSPGSVELVLEDFRWLRKPNLASSACLECAVHISCACSCSERGCTCSFQERA